MHMRYVIGMSGWSYKEWKEVFYPEGLPQTDFFSYYSSQFSSVEVNTSFYYLPKASTIQKWYETSPEDFTFTLKAPQAITHDARLQNVQEDLTRFYQASNGLHEKAGAHLFQLPPSFRCSAKTYGILKAFVLSLPKEKDNVIEFRHTSWENEETINLLRAHHVAMCHVSERRVNTKLIRTGDFIYCRLHGENYATRYPEEDIETLAALITESGVERAYIYFNNTKEGVGIPNAKHLAALLS
ncbi:DUF72 domain-containing protein [Aneurinibacillus sp. REN35]|uniref:DUF72 domain-containing protein n=1 Tax=Aneurinibacillus sp. REN35 TaxID=3237286 RepID=UPI003527DEA9